MQIKCMSQWHISLVLSQPAVFFSMSYSIEGCSRQYISWSNCMESQLDLDLHCAKTSFLIAQRIYRGLVREEYSIYPKYWDTLIPYHTSKIWISLHENCWMSSKQCRPCGLRHLIWVCPVCSDLSVPILRAITVYGDNSVITCLFSP